MVIRFHDVFGIPLNSSIYRLSLLRETSLHLLVPVTQFYLEYTRMIFRDRLIEIEKERRERERERERERRK